MYNNGYRSVEWTPLAIKHTDKNYGRQWGAVIAEGYYREQRATAIGRSPWRWDQQVWLY